jgi:hypothetical protein
LDKVKEEGECEEDNAEDAEGEIWSVARFNVSSGRICDREEDEPIDYDIGVVGSVRVWEVGVNESGAYVVTH